jgi:ATP-dependent Zn protease
MKMYSKNRFVILFSCLVFFHSIAAEPVVSFPSVAAKPEAETIVSNFKKFDKMAEENYDLMKKSFLGGVILDVATFVVSLSLIGIMSRDIMDRSMGRRSQKEDMGSVVEDTSLKDYAGTIPAAVLTLVDQIKNREAYKAVNAPVTKGILLTGLPGTGKSFLARAIAGEIKCPFYATSATDFAAPWFGVSEMKIRDLFDSLRSAAANDPSKLAILFIDEIDAIGARNATFHGGQKGILQTFLTEMDGFNKSEVTLDVHVPWYKRILSSPVPVKQPVDIVILAATNTPEKLDFALKRKGRFDHIIEIENPDEAGRQAIATLYLKKYPHDENIRADKLARVTEGMSPADINALFGEAARNAAEKKQKIVGIKNFCYALLQAQKNEKKQVASGIDKFLEAKQGGMGDEKRQMYDFFSAISSLMGDHEKSLGGSVGSDRKEVLELFLTMYPCNQTVTIENLMNSSLVEKTNQEIATIFEDAYKKSQVAKRLIEMSDLV